MDEVLNIYQKLAKVRQLCEVIAKNKNGYGYKYTTVDEILAKVTAGMKKYNLSLLPKMTSASVEPHTYQKTKALKNGEVYNENVNEYLFRGWVNFTWINEENPEEQIEVPWYIAGSQSDPSQASGTALSYGLRYFLLQYFQIATLDGDDPDNWRSKQKEAENQEDAMASKAIIDNVNEIVQEYLKDNPKKKADVATVVKEYVKLATGTANANYYKITNPVIAGQLLEKMQTIVNNGGK